MCARVTYLGADDPGPARGPRRQVEALAAWDFVAAAPFTSFPAPAG